MFLGIKKENDSARAKRNKRHQRLFEAIIPPLLLRPSGVVNRLNTKSKYPALQLMRVSRSIFDAWLVLCIIKGSSGYEFTWVPGPRPVGVNMRNRKALIIAVALPVGIIAVGVVVNTLANISTPIRERASQAASWLAVIGILGVMLYIMIQIFWHVTKSKSKVELIEDQDTLKHRYAEMRRTAGARLIQAIWSAKYPDVETYFRTEGRDLETDRKLRIDRLVNPDLIAEKDRKEFVDFVRRHENLRVYATDVNEFECFLCEYTKGGEPHLKALLVLNNTLSHTPQIGIYIDPEKHPHLEPLAFAIQSWFMKLPKKQFPGLDRIENIWEVNAPSYDDLVTNSELPSLRSFMDQEQTLLETEVTSLCETGAPITVIEVGTGTARTLLNLARKTELMKGIRYLIGVDSSQAMIRIARNHLKIQVLPDEMVDKYFFFHIAGENLAQYLIRGRLMLERFRSDKINGESVDRLDTKAYDNSRKLICCLLNTLGVMERETRTQVIRSMVAAATPADVLIFSVFCADAFSERAPELYAEIDSLVGGYSRDCLDMKKCKFETSSYFSHWFNISAFQEQLKAEDCDVIDVRPISDWGHLLSCRVR